MATKKEEPQVRKPRAAKPAADPASREKQLMSLAIDLAEKQLRDGTASPSVIGHFLKIASTREAIEREILEKQASLITAKEAALTSGKDAAELTKKAIEAMQHYSTSN